MTDDLPACLATVRPRGTMTLPRPGLADPEGACLPAGLPPVIDAHVHLFEEKLFQAIWRWFEKHGWPIRYPLPPEDVVAFLLSRGVEHLVALHYAHKPGIARRMNQFVAAISHAEPRVIGFATVFPGEPEAAEILEDAFADGLRGVKLHCHVQAMSPDAPALHEIYATCAAYDLPLVIHAGREPSSAAYPVDTYTLCAAERLERVLLDHPTLRVVVPHLGADELAAYLSLVERYDNLWLDTTMMAADYFEVSEAWRVIEARPERIMYGTDFPNLPYAWDREITCLAERLPDHALAQVLGGTARALLRLSEPVV